jgi:dTDP-4-amino-4,6-dideoxygalactose transaminase
MPVTEWLTAQTLILPLFHDLTEPEQDIVVSVISAAAQHEGPRRAPAHDAERTAAL